MSVSTLNSHIRTAHGGRTLANARFSNWSSNGSTWSGSSMIAGSSLAADPYPNLGRYLSITSKTNTERSRVRQRECTVYHKSLLKDRRYEKDANRYERKDYVCPQQGYSVRATKSACVCGCVWVWVWGWHCVLVLVLIIYHPRSLPFLNTLQLCKLLPLRLWLWLGNPLLSWKTKSWRWKLQHEAVFTKFVWMLRGDTPRERTEINGDSRGVNDYAP